MGLKNNNVAIKEGNLTRRIYQVDKLKINTTDNKDSTWVASDKSNTGVLHASENGIYIASEDGYEAYSEVIVRVTKDSFEGDTNFDDWDYETPDMDLDNWDPETIEDFELDPDGFDDVFNNEDEWKDIDKPIDIKMDNPKIKDTKISGIDPVTGNEMEVGLDEDGYLTESTLPSSIVIETPPNKLQYVSGQTIDFRGMVVKAYTADGELWIDESHPDGVIPHSELTFPVTIAVANEDTEDNSKYATSELDTSPLEQPIPFGSTLRQDGEYSAYRTAVYSKTVSGADAVIAYGSNNYVYLFAASEPFTLTEHVITKWKNTGDIIQDKTNSDSHSIEYWEYKGKTVHYLAGTNSFSDLREVSLSPTVPMNFYNSGRLREIAWTLVYGDITEFSRDVNVPVQYIRSDGEVLEDSFTIEVLPDPDGSDHTRTDAIEYNGAYYKANPNLNVEAHYASGTVWNSNTGAIYNTRDAVALGLLIPDDGNGSQHVGGDF